MYKKCIEETKEKLKKSSKSAKMSKSLAGHMKEYKEYSPSQLKKHMADEKVLLKMKMAKKK